MPKIVDKFDHSTECFNCGTTFTWTKKEIKVRQKEIDNGFGRQVWDEHFIVCPNSECSNHIVVQR